MVGQTSQTIQLAPDEGAILNGAQGPVMQKVMETLVRYGEALRAERLVAIEGPGHFVIPWSSPGIAPPITMLEELAAAGLQTAFPFTLDPGPPLDFENLRLDPDEEQAILEMYRDQARYDELMLALGLRDEDAYTCNPYQPEIGNIPERGTVLAWSESACAAFANSVLGARTNRNGAIMDLLSNIVGKTPYAGLVTDEGRAATWLIDVQADDLPNPQLLGAAVGKKVGDGVPYIEGLDGFLSADLDQAAIDYLQEMGAACATYGAVGLFHVGGITPEARDFGSALLAGDHHTYVIDADELEAIYNAFPNRWDEPEAAPERCYIGCPHLSLRQLHWWADAIDRALSDGGRDIVAVDTVLFTAPGILRAFTADREAYSRLTQAGVRFSAACCETVFETGLCAGKPYLTNSTKLRAYTSARFFRDEELARILAAGDIGGG
jgi:predicted aconitase